MRSASLYRKVRMKALPSPAVHAALLLAVLVLGNTHGFAQTGPRIEIVHADAWQFDQQLAPGAQRLTGKVAFRHAQAEMRCDSAYLFEDQTVQAFGNVRIVQGDTLELVGDRLHYDGRDRVARLDGRVRLTEPGMTLETEQITYDLRSRQAVYSRGGRLTGRRDGSVLTSDRGTYLAAARTFIFSGQVHLSHPEYDIVADTLHYATATGVATFQGPTTMTAQGTRMWCTRGTYDTREQLAHLTRDSRVITDAQELRGDTLRFDQRSGIGLAYGHVAVIDSANGLIVAGDRGRHDRRAEHTWISGNAELRMDLGGDTLYLHGDTLYAETIRRPAWEADGMISTSKRITARRGARFFKSDLQGVCDTLIYEEADSVIHLLHRPALWSGADQITGDRIRMTLREGRPHLLHVEGNGFIASQVDSAHYDQVTGSTITGYFHDGQLDHLLAQGTCRTVYYAREGAPGEEQLIGMNRADCSKIRVTVRAGAVHEITFVTKPDAVLYPLAQAPPEETLLRGFVWRGKERPLDRASIFPSSR